MRLDSHQHFWHYRSEEYPWISDEMKALRRDFMPGDLGPMLEDLRMDGSIAVQARETLDETRWLLALADSAPSIRGVVGWVDLASPHAERDMERFAGHPRFRGVRMVIQDQPDPEFAISPGHSRGIELLERFGLTYDLLLKPPHLFPAIQLVDRFPNQPFVVDHIAKPDIRSHQFLPWRDEIEELAHRPNVYCKLSGMVTEADWEHWKPTDLHPYLDIVLSAFGPERLMIGSDWPVCLVAGPYEKVMDVVIEWATGLSGTEQDGILGDNAARFYGIE